MTLRVTIALGLAALLLLAGLAWTAVAYSRNRQWKEGEARVSSNAINPYQTSAGRMFRPEATFQYTVAGKQFLTPRPFETSFGSEPEARAFVNGYAPLTRLRMFYDAANPHALVLDNSELSRNLRWPVVMLGAGVLVIAIALFQTWRANRAVCQQCALPVELWDKFCWGCGAKLPKRLKRVHRLLA